VGRYDYDGGKVKHKIWNPALCRVVWGIEQAADSGQDL